MSLGRNFSAENPARTPSPETLCVIELETANQTLRQKKINLHQLMKLNIRIIFSIILTIIGFGIIVWFVYRGYYAEKFIDPNIPVDLDFSSKFGDFIGGVAGTLFSFVGVILLFETLSLQRKEFTSNIDVYKHQQFDNAFFELLNLHKENLKGLSLVDIQGNTKEGRDFFIHNKEYLQNLFTPQTSLSANKRNSVDLFRMFYVNYEEQLSIYFKTLYQLYSLIQHSEIDGEHQAKYSKILRAQLSDAELFFIRYNAMTELGDQSSNYLNIFNVLKHLSHFELLEFKFWFSRLSKFERNGLSTIIKEVKSVLKIFLIDDEVNEIEKVFKKGRYKIRLQSNQKHEFSFEIIIDSTKNPPGQYIIDGLEHFNHEEIENLFKCIFKEYLFYSNFFKYNNIRKVRIYKDISTTNHIKLTIKNIEQKPIKVHYWY